MSLHKNPKYQSSDLIEALRNHGLETKTPSQLSDAFRTGWVAAMAQRDELVAKYVAQPVQPAAVTTLNKSINYREIADCVISDLDGRKGILCLDVDDEIEEEIRQEVVDTIENMVNTSQPTPVAQAEPLSDEQIDEIFKHHHITTDVPWVNWRSFARAIIEAQKLRS